MMRGIDLRECDDPSSDFTLRRLYIAFNALPFDNRVLMGVSGITPEEASWGPDVYVLANVFDAIQQLTYLTEAINTPKNQSRPKPPKPHPRPGLKNPARPRRGDWFPGKTRVVK